MGNCYYDANVRFVQTEYGRQPTFSSFLPGIAGPRGIPTWCNYNNRGQAVCSFGVQDKDHAILEFTAAAAAYQRTPLTGFRTFLKENGKVTEAFADGLGTMTVEPNVLTISWRDSLFAIEVTYFSLPNERMAGLCRRVRLKNISPKAVETELLDGLAAMVPYGISDEKLKQEPQLSTAWMQVEDLEENLPYYRVRASMEDTAKVTAVRGGNFKLAFAEGGRPLETIVQPSLIFGWDTSMVKPANFEEHALSEITSTRQLMLIDLTQHATRCSDSSGQAQEYLIARHAAVETETVLVQICLELGAPSVICSLKECFQITDCLVYPMQIICFVFLCVQFHTFQIQVASVTVAFYLRFRHKILVDDFLQSLSLYVIYYLHPGKQWCTVCGFGYGHHNLGLIRTTTSFAVMGRSANIAVIQLYNAGKQVFFVSLTHSGTNSIQ